MLWIESDPALDPASGATVMRAPMGGRVITQAVPSAGSDPELLAVSPATPIQVAVQRHETGLYDGDGTLQPENGNRDQNAYSTGFYPPSVRLPRLTGQVLQPVKSRQIFAQQVVGKVGQSNHLNQLYAGVKSQSTTYLPTTQDQIMRFFAMYGDPTQVAAPALAKEED